MSNKKANLALLFLSVHFKVVISTPFLSGFIKEILFKSSEQSNFHSNEVEQIHCAGLAQR